MMNVTENAGKFIAAANEELKELKRQRSRFSLQALLSDFAACEELESVESKILSLEKRIEWAKLAVDEAESQAQLNTNERKIEALERLKEMLAELDQQERKLKPQIRGNSAPELVNECATVARQAHALAHDIFEITKDRKFRRQWPTDPAKIRSNPFLKKPPVPKPWAEDLEIARG